jgi:hypothetical protein
MAEITDRPVTSLRLQSRVASQAFKKEPTMRYFDLFTIFFAQLMNFLFGLLGNNVGT